jgi:hypothetical protein
VSDRYKVDSDTDAYFIRDMKQGGAIVYDNITCKEEAESVCENWNREKVKEHQS